MYIKLFDKQGNKLQTFKGKTLYKNASKDFPDLYLASLYKDNGEYVKCLYDANRGGLQV